MSVARSDGRGYDLRLLGDELVPAELSVRPGFSIPRIRNEWFAPENAGALVRELVRAVQKTVYTYSDYARFHQGTLS